MDAIQIVIRLRKHAEELMQSANTRMATLGTVPLDDDSESQQLIRKAAQCDFYASRELSRDADEIEAEAQKDSSVAPAF